ncbi:nucleotide exchange factor GrpE [Salinivirga cyanobacteriivorans]|uniref:Protein GrpE n=1 Tax=Salinivirga cyanobacteriivorans TaxID=1307839 RepID=A0A0S2HX78_9BACT|nr:nucleotide exchange factor GrpE [Salinivirga cyanobacteriivorans]ALO14697.1 HSP-70 cofactor [Salinivirga cyanobacteriivorans]
MVDKSKQKEEEKKQQQASNVKQESSARDQSTTHEEQQAVKDNKDENKESSEKEEETKDHKKSTKDSKAKSSKKGKKKDPKEEKIQELGEQVEKLNDRYMRLQAEFDNYRKRTIKEKADLLKSAGEDVLKDMLPVIDDMDRAIETIEAAEDKDAIKAGMQLIDQKFKEFVKQKGVSEIDAMHQEFDTDVHEAMTKIPAPKEELKGKVVDVIQKGYKLNDKVIRFAKVVIGE